MTGLVVFDCDGTLTMPHQANPYLLVAKRHGVETDFCNAIKLFENGVISYPALVAMELNMLKTAGCRTLADFYGSLPLPAVRPEAKSVIHKLKQHGVHTALLSSGLDVLAHAVAREVGISFENVYCNYLPTDENGGFNYTLVSQLAQNRSTDHPDANCLQHVDKGQSLRHILAPSFGISLQQTAYVGNDLWDLSAMSATLQNGGKVFYIGDDDYALHTPLFTPVHSLDQILPRLQLSRNL